MPQIFVESYVEFSKRHGHDAVAVSDGRLMFSDGAQCDSEQGLIRTEPPDNERDRLSLCRMYVNTKLKLAEKHFAKVRGEFSDQAMMAARYENLSGPPTNAPQSLRKLKRTALKHRAELEAVDKQLAETREGKLLAAQDERRSKRVQELHQLRTEINAVDLDGVDSEEKIRDDRRLKKLVEEDGKLLNTLFKNSGMDVDKIEESLTHQGEKMNTLAHDKHVLTINEPVSSLTGLPRKKRNVGADAIALPPYPEKVVNAKKFTGDEDDDDDLLIPPSLIPRIVECESCFGTGRIFNQLSGEDDTCLLCQGRGHTGGDEEFPNVDATTVASITPEQVGNKRADDDLLLPPGPMFAPVANAASEPDANSDLLLPPGPMFAPIVTNGLVKTTTIEEAQQNRKNMEKVDLMIILR